MVLTTRDRAEPLRRCLDALSAQNFDPDDIEFVLVDNGSRDDTALIAREWLTSKRRGRYVHVAEAGLSRARNEGIAVACGELIAFVDDDVRPAHDWAQSIVDSFRRHPHAAVVGGRVILDWRGSAPRWMRPGLEHWYAALDLGSAERIVQRPQTLFGANLSVRRTHLEAAGQFDPSLGRVGKTLISGEEGDLIDRLRRFGDIVYDPSLVVTHEVLPERSTRRWLVRRAFGQGRTDVRRQRVAGSAARVALGALARPHRLVTNPMVDILRRTQVLGQAYELVRR